MGETVVIFIVILCVLYLIISYFSDKKNLQEVEKKLIKEVEELTIKENELKIKFENFKKNHPDILKFRNIRP